MGRTRIKMCGMTRPQDAYQAACLGVDAIGLIFYSQSPRHVTAKQAVEIIESIPAFVTVVGVFVNANATLVEEILDQVPIDLLQFHGDETANFCEGFLCPYIKTISVYEEIDIRAEGAPYKSARAWLLDKHDVVKKGGTGEFFNWDLIPADLEKPIILAGGLNDENVSAAITKVRPYAVDVCSGVESTKGIKNINKMQSFIDAVRRADATS